MHRPVRQRPLGFLAALVALLLVAGACGGDNGGGSTTGTTGTGATTGGSTVADADVDPDGVLRVAVDLGASGGLKFDPTKMATGQYVYSTPVLRSLLVRTEDGTLVPDLAESAEVVDASTVKAVLRPGLLFSDGTPLDAAAVKATFERNVASANSAGLQIGDMKLVSSITVDSPTELTIALAQPSAAVVYALLAGVEFAPVSPASFAEADAGDGTTVVGAGPMVLASYTPESSVTFVRNPNYWDADSVTLGGLEYVQTQAGPSIANALRSDAVDYGVVTTDQANGFSDPYAISQHTMTAPNYLQWCMKEGSPLGSAKVRQAVAYSIDREAFSQAVYGGRSEVAWDLWPEASIWHDPELDGVFEHDVPRAKQLLTEAGYPDGFSFRMLAGPAVTRDLEVLQAQLAEAGIDMELVGSTNPLDYYVDLKTDATYSQGRPGPLDKVSRHFLSTSFTNACKFPAPETDALHAKLAGLPLEGDEAIATWKDLQELVVRDLAWHPTTTFQQHIAVYNADHVGDLAFYFDQLGGRQANPVGTTMRRA